MATPEKWLFDGWELTNKVAWGWAHRDGTNEAAAFVGANTTVPSRSGELWRPKVQGPGRFAIDLWLKGATQAEVHANWRTVLRAMRRRHRQVVVTRYMPDGERIECNAEVIGTIAPQHLSQRVWRASVTFNIPDGVWRSYTTYSAQVAPAAPGSTRTVTMTDWEPCTEAMDELTLTMAGPGTGWYVSDVTDGALGDWVRYNAAIPAGCALVLNCKTWNVGYTGTWTPDLGALQYSGSRFLSVPAPRPGAVPELRLTLDSGSTGATSLTVHGPRAYAC